MRGTGGREKRLKPTGEKKFIASYPRGECGMTSCVKPGGGKNA